MTTRRNVEDVVPRNRPAHGVRQQDTTAKLKYLLTYLRRCCFLLTLVDKESELVVNPLSRLQADFGFSRLGSRSRDSIFTAA